MENRNRSRKLKDIWLGGIYYIPVVLLYVLNMANEAVRPGIIATVFMFCVLAELSIVCYLACQKRDAAWCV